LHVVAFYFPDPCCRGEGFATSCPDASRPLIDLAGVLFGIEAAIDGCVKLYGQT
jgi:hypothetical protein